MKPALLVLLAATISTAMPPGRTAPRPSSNRTRPKLPWMAQSSMCGESWWYLMDGTATLQSVERTCGTRQVCHAFGRGRHRNELLTQTLRQRYGFHSEQDCLQAHCPEPRTGCDAIIHNLYYRPVSLFPACKIVEEAVCGEGPFCLNFDNGGPFNRANLKRIIHKHGYQNVRQCLHGEERKLRLRNVWYVVEKFNRASILPI